MPFLAPLIPALVAGTASAGAGYGLSKLFGGAPSGFGSLMGTQQQLAQLGAGTAATTIPEAANFWGALLSGDTTQLMRTMQPEVGSILSQYDTSRKMTSEFGPRASGTAGTIAQSRFQEAGDISNLLSRARQEAARNLAGLGTSAAGVSTSAAGTGISGLLSQEQIQNAVMASMGGGLGQLFALMMLRQQGGGKGGGGGGGDDFQTLLDILFAGSPATSSGSLATEGVQG